MTQQLNSRSFGLILISLAWAAFLTIIGSPEVLLFTVPVFMLTAPLALGRYLGDGLIEKLVRTKRRQPDRRIMVPARFSGSLAATIRGSLLIASNLAGRAPPASAA